MQTNAVPTQPNGATTPLMGATPQAIQNHYDLSNSFYRLWLDPRMVYSCALWQEGDTLEQAQIRKFDHHIRESGASGQERILDIGCGWGGLLKRALADHGTQGAVGLTLSQAQLEYARGVLPAEQCELRLESWADHAPAKPYDAIISVGAFEHFARIEHTEAEKVGCYRKFFEKSRELLKTDGLMSLQTFAYGNVRSREQTARSEGTQFMAREIFEETDPPRLINIVEAAAGLFEIVNLRNDRLHYAKTCKVWLQNLKKCKEEATLVVGADNYEKYVKYLTLSYLGFQVGHLDLYRITFRPVKTYG